MFFLLDPSQLLITYGYIGVFIIVFLESGIFFLLPGDSLLFTAGIVAAGGGFNIFYLILLIFFATLIGGIVGYLIGVYIEHLHNYRLFRKILKPEHISKAHQFFDEYGRMTIILSRFVPIVRTFVPIVAGIARMNFQKFIIYSIISSLVWSTSVTLVGYFLGRRFPLIVDYLHYLVVVIVLVSVVPIAVEWWRKRRQGSRTN